MNLQFVYESDLTDEHGEPVRSRGEWYAAQALDAANQQHRHAEAGVHTPLQ